MMTGVGGQIHLTGAGRRAVLACCDQGKRGGISRLKTKIPHVEGSGIFLLIFYSVCFAVSEVIQRIF